MGRLIFKKTIPQNYIIGESIPTFTVGWNSYIVRKVVRGDSFNCTNVLLDRSDLEFLEAAVRNNLLPYTEGFFFGMSDGSELNDDLAFIQKARDAIAAGKSVYYSSWW